MLNTYFSITPPTGGSSVSGVSTSLDGTLGAVSGSRLGSGVIDLSGFGLGTGDGEVAAGDGGGVGVGAAGGGGGGGAAPSMIAFQSNL